MLRIGRSGEIHRANSLHSHKCYEVLLYTKGEGYIFADGTKYPFSHGTVLILPPETKHMTYAENSYENIYVNGDLEQFFQFSKPRILSDNERREAELLATVLYNNRLSGEDLVSSLCSAYMYFVMKNLKTESSMDSAVNRIVYKITDSFHDNSLCLKELLSESGYAEDYIRAHFKKITGKTPNGFLTDVRIRHACILIEVYENSLSLSEIAELCGYTDYIYFSKKFKSVTGESPIQYRKRVKN